MVNFLLFSMLDNADQHRDLSIQKMKVQLFLSFQFIFSFITSLPLFINHVKSDSSSVMISSVIFMMTPLISVLIIRRVIPDKSHFYLKFQLKKQLNLYLFAAFSPGALTAIGAIIYFMIYPDKLDLNHSYLQDLLKEYEKELFLPQFTPTILIGMTLSCIFIAPLIFVNHIAAFGEEIGWRCFLLPLLIDLHGKKKAVFICNFLWGAFHAPLVYFGLNYSGDYFLCPWSGMLMMSFFGLVLGIPLSYLTLKTKSVFPACIFHGAFNAIREVPLFLCTSDFNPLIGPKPSGLIGMIGFILLAFLLFRKI